MRPPISGSSQINVGAKERLASTAAGALLTLYGLKRLSLGGLALAATGGALLYRGLTGYCPINDATGRDSTEGDRTGRPLEIHTSLTVQKPREEVFAFWRRLENLPRFMHHLSEVRTLDDRRSYWVALIPKGMGRVEWEAELKDEEPNRRLAWRSVPKSTIDNAGEVKFEDAPGGRGTEVRVHLSYRPPAGDAGKLAAKLLNPAFEQMVKEDLRRFKHVMEAGEVPTIEGQPSGR